jgi:hypothetical protein
MMPQMVGGKPDQKIDDIDDRTTKRVIEILITRFDLEIREEYV